MGPDPDHRSEATDDDRLAGDHPPEEPLGVNQYGTTPAEQRIPEPIEERVRREKPESATVGDVDGAGRLVAPDEGVGPDDEATAVATEITDVAAHDRPARDVGTGDMTRQEGATELVRDLSAEEAAVRVHKEP